MWNHASLKKSHMLDYYEETIPLIILSLFKLIRELCI